MRFFIGGLTLVALGFSPAGAMSVDEAYQDIPHNRTVFEPGTAQSIPDVERRYLIQFFAWIDQAIIANAVSRRNGDVPHAYEKTWSVQAGLRPSPKLRHVQELVGAAIQDEYVYLKERQQMSVRSFDAGHPRVQAASRRLHQAYSELMTLYPAENAHNKQAFFDYLCALDFL